MSRCTGKRWFNGEYGFIRLESAPALKRGIRAIPGLARLAHPRRSADQVRNCGFRRGRPGGVLSRTIEFGNEGEGSLTVFSDERLGGTGQKTLSSPRKSHNS